MLYKYLFVCIAFILIENAASDISLDYYYGFEDTLRSSKYLANCNSADESCQERCGNNYACLLGKCFCVDITPQIKGAVHVSNINSKECDRLFSKLRVLDDELAKARAYQRYPKESSNDKNNSGESKSEESTSDIFQKLRANNVDGTTSPGGRLKELNLAEKNHMFLGKAKTNDEDEREASGDGDSFEKSRSEESNLRNKILEEMALRPTLRHHIAHFCPNLDIARKCIHKCMERNRPAFCGKDHVCYCGHRYGTPNDKILESEDSGQFADLYEKYFGPRTQYRTQTKSHGSNDTDSANSNADIDPDITGDSAREETSDGEEGFDKDEKK